MLALFGVVLVWLLFCEPFDPPWEDPPPLPLEAEEVPLVSDVVEPVVEELGATGMVDSAVPLELDALGLPPPLPPPTPGNADPYWSCEGEVAPAVGASTAAKSAIAATAIANLGM